MFKYKKSSKFSRAISRAKMIDFRSATAVSQRPDFISASCSERSSESCSPKNSPLTAKDLLGKDLLLQVNDIPSLTSASSGSTSPSEEPRKSRLLSPEANKQVFEARKAELVGKTIIGTLSDRSTKGHFITWNSRTADTIFVSSKLVEECLTNGWKPRMKVTCTIQGIGPDYVPADKQHPFTKKIEYLPEEKSPAKQSHFFNLASGSKWNKTGYRQGWQRQGGVKSKSAMEKTRMMDRMARRRGGKPNSNFVFSHSAKTVESSDANPMAIGRSDAVKSWRK